MFYSQEAITIKTRYEGGERNFQEFQLRRADLRGLDLQNTDFRGVDLSCANLRDVNFRGADLREAYLNEADLTGTNFSGANLEGASLIKTYLIKANCYQTNLKGVYLTGAYLTKTSFKEANLAGAYLNGAKLTGAYLEDAYYDQTTRFDISFNPKKVRMTKIDNNNNIIEEAKEKDENLTSVTDQEITVQEILDIFNHLVQISRRYIGKTMTQKYWEASRPVFEWLELFEINSAGEISFNGDLETLINSTKFQWLQAWFKTFIQSCSQIFHNYPKMLDEHLVKRVILPDPIKKNDQPSSSKKPNFLTSVKSNELSDLIFVNR